MFYLCFDILYFNKYVLLVWVKSKNVGDSYRERRPVVFTVLHPETWFWGESVHWPEPRR
jgi:hypothetical protein